MREDLFAKITGLTNNSYFDGAHEVRHYLRKHSDLGHIVLEVAKVCRNSELSMSQLYKPIIIQSLARNGILRKPFLRWKETNHHTQQRCNIGYSTFCQSFYQLAILHVGLSICKKGPWFDETCKSGERKMEFMLT
ncbi:hypothetical protein ZEAMMB73_Zm00001d005588 [Zea mays]|uniref:Uncharacterized protein n=1 Tax=Zea mays TaxID=4577 RepID=A0A1D6EP28_MAIZE|nr:hypothetical protein ZEAMMB73_Zm00001d005588 [Zea mays]